MVKTRLFFLGSLPLLFALLVGCRAMTGGAGIRTEVLEIKDGVPGKHLSLVISGTTLVGVFSDKESTTLKILELPVGVSLPPAAPAATVLDRIDVTPPLSPAFGEHTLAVTGTRVEVLYAARHNEDHTALKLAYRDAGSAQWKLDIVDPPGDPVALLPRGDSSLSLFWASGGLLSRAFPSNDAGAVVQQPFQLLGRASVFSPEGFTVFDGASQRLEQVTLGESGPAFRSIAGASEVHSSLLDPEGMLAVLTWDAHSRRLLLLEEKKDRTDFSRTTVTLSDGTTAVALLPPHKRSGFLFLFDEVRRSATASTEYQLSLLSPGSLLGGIGTHYEKTAVLSGPQPIEGMAALETSDSIYALVLQGTLKLIRIGLPP